MKELLIVLALLSSNKADQVYVNDSIEHIWEKSKTCVLLDSLKEINPFDTINILYDSKKTNSIMSILNSRIAYMSLATGNIFKLTNSYSISYIGNYEFYSDVDKRKYIEDLRKIFYCDCHN
jgi:hypothetical protein